MTGEAFANGRMKINLDFASTGQSIHDLVGNLGGVASVALTDVDVEKAGKGSTMSGLLVLLTSLNKLGGSNINDQAQMTGTFKISRGIAHSNDIKIASAYGNGAAAGGINLPAWNINMEGQMQLGRSFITQLLKAKIRETSSTVPFAITGALDAPNVKVDTGALLGAGILIPGADALLKKAPKAAGNDDDSEDDFAPGPPIKKGSVPEKPAPEIVPKDPKKRRVIEDDGLSDDDDDLFGVAAPAAAPEKPSVQEDSDDDVFGGEPPVEEEVVEEEPEEEEEDFAELDLTGEQEPEPVKDDATPTEEVAQQWDALRREVVSYAIEKLLAPLFIDEIRLELKRRGQKAVAALAANALKRMADVQPFAVV